MRLVNFGPAGAERPGVLVDGDVIVPLESLLGRDNGRPHRMNDVIARWDALRPLVAAGLADAPERLPAAGVRIAAPVPRPGKIIAIGFNYPHHTGDGVDAGDAVLPPVVFLKPSTSVSGPYDPVIKPPETSMLDYEVELGVVIGRAGRRIPPVKALDHVMGYVVANDITARDVALGAGLDHPLRLQIARGKGFPTFCPLGPWLVTADEVPTPAELRLELRVNGTVRQHDLAGRMLVPIPELIASVSATMDLEPGDLIRTGTPGGCGFQLDPPTFLYAGDTVLAGITGLGEMSFTVEDERA